MDHNQNKMIYDQQENSLMFNTDESSYMNHNSIKDEPNISMGLFYRQDRPIDQGMQHLGTEYQKSPNQ